MKSVLLSITCLLLLSLEIGTTTAKVRKTPIFNAKVQNLGQKIHSLMRQRRSADPGTWYILGDANTGSFRCYDFVTVDGLQSHVEVHEPIKVTYPDFCGVITIKVKPPGSSYPLVTKIHLSANEYTFGPRDRILGGKCTSTPTPLLEGILLSAYKGMQVSGIKICGCDTDLCNGY